MQYSDVPTDTDLLLILDSSSSEVEECKRLSETMDIIIIDHHNLEVEENPYVILVNPQQPGCEYPNKKLSASALVFKFIELMDYQYQKVNVKHYLDLVATSLLSDQMDMRVLENRYFVKMGMSKIHNVGLLALINSTRNANKKINAQIMNFDIIPILNTTTRNNEMRKAFSLLFEKDYFKAKAKADWLVNDNKERKNKVKHMTKEFESIMQNEKFIFVTTENTTKNYNGLISQQLASKYKKPAMVLKDDGKTYQGSYRSYNNFPLQDFLKECPYVEYAAGHMQAGGIEVKHGNWDKFKQYVDENIEESLFDPVIEYDLELTEDELDWDLVNEIESFNEVWGNGHPPISIRINDVFVEDRELFPQKKPEHVKIIASNVDMLYFNDNEFAKDISAWDYISSVGSIGINDFGGDRRIQLFIEDYQKK